MSMLLYIDYFNKGKYTYILFVNKNMKIIGLFLIALELFVLYLKLYPLKYTTYFKALIVTFKFIFLIYTG